MVEISIFNNEPTQRRLAAGEPLFEAGDSGAHMFGVIEGTIEVVIGDRVVETVDPGGVLGEMAILDDSPRSATARAATDAVVAEIDQQRFMMVVKSNPFFAIEIMKALADRLRRRS